MAGPNSFMMYIKPRMMAVYACSGPIAQGMKRHALDPCTCPVMTVYNMFGHEDGAIDYFNSRITNVGRFQFTMGNGCTLTICCNSGDTHLQCPPTPTCSQEAAFVNPMDTDQDRVRHASHVIEAEDEDMRDLIESVIRICMN
jgi:hypothetical protein